MFKFSILIPTWNNLPHLELCIDSLRKNSAHPHQLIVYVNEGKDGTVEWIKQQADIDFLHSEKNEGVCVAMNACRSLIKNDYMVYLNDDMYVCPGWDLALYDEIEKIGHDQFMLSSTVIEPYPSSNPNVVSIVKDYGDSLETFREQDLLKEYAVPVKGDWMGASWPPSVVSTRMWDIVGGYSIEFSPGFYSDPDLSMKLWKQGVRIFKGVGQSRTYHFQSKSTNRIRKKSRGRDVFLKKWGLSARIFYSQVLRMGQPYDPAALGDLCSLSIGDRIRFRLQRAYYALFKAV